jgi:CubicO group peptidase (beta-lactamase class C family)
MTEIHGEVAPGFEAVRTAFTNNFDQHGDVGAAFALYVKGRQVVDLWGGVADETTGAPWEQDTMVLVFSTTKGATALTANILAERGAIDVDAPVAEYWPEFAAHGKERVTVDHLLSHRAGLAWTDRVLSVDEALAWEPVVRALEEQVPAWEPGTRHGYHATTFGWLVGEVVRRVTGTSLGTAFRTEVGEPLGLDFYIGLPESEEHRVARLISILDSIASGRVAFGGTGGISDGGEASETGRGADNAYLAALAERAAQYLAPDGPLTKALTAPVGSLEDNALLDSPKLHGAELPAYNGIGDARSLARMYAACIGEVVNEHGDKVRLLGDDQLDAALRQRTEGPDEVLLGLDIHWGLGFMVNRGILAQAGLGGPRAFGHFGMGGSGGWADPDAELALGYVMNRMDIGTTGDRRLFSLAKACYEVAASG